MMKAQEQHVSSNKPEQKKTLDTGLRSPVVKQKDNALLVRDGAATVDEFKEHTMYSYQQISCLDSVIRYLESCNIPNTVKRKYQFSSNTTSSNSDEDKKASDDLLGMEPTSVSVKTNEKPLSGAAQSRVVGGALSPLDLPGKADSVVSQCSYSSTIVHVGDKKTHPESEIIEDVAESPIPSAPVSVVSPPTMEQEAYKKLGLTKQVLAAHTQKEEQAFLSRCRDIRNGQSLQKDCPSGTHKKRGQAAEGARGSKPEPGLPVTEATAKRSWRTKKSKKPRTKHPNSADNAAYQHRPLPPLQGLNQTSWSPSETSQSGLSVPFPTVVPGYPIYPVAPSIAPPHVPTGVAESQTTPAAPSAAAYPTPLVTPVVAFVLPSFMLPQMGAAAQQPYNALQDYNNQHHFQPQQAHNGQQPFQPQQAYSIQAQHVYTSQQTFQPQQHLQNLQGCSPQPTFTPQMHAEYGLTSDPKRTVIESTECPSPLPPTHSPPLFESRCSSPLQLDLLQLEEKQDLQTTVPQTNNQGSCSSVQNKNNSTALDGLAQTCCSGKGDHCGDHSSSSSVLELLLQEDSHSGTGSAMSASTGSTSNDCNTSNSGTGSITSKYFGSVDSSESNHKSGEIVKEQEQNFAEYVHQDPVWRLMADDDDDDVMTYQVPSRDMEKVLGEDRERLRRMQKNQPCFSSEQRRELIDQHPWMRRGGLPKAINIMECMYCENDVSGSLEGDLPEMDLGILGGEMVQDGQSHSKEKKEQPIG